MPSQQCLNADPRAAGGGDDISRHPRFRRGFSPGLSMQKNSTWTVQQTARNCAGQFSILSPGEKCQSKKGIVEILSFSKAAISCGSGGVRFARIETESYAASMD